MKTLIINDKKIGFEEGRTILQVATANGIHIPSLCCLEDCKNGGQCGICVVEIEGQDNDGYKPSQFFKINYCPMCGRKLVKE